jgi:predicted N-acetyltransferase YhbS
MASTSRRQLAIVQFTPEHAEGLAAFYRRVWDPAATAASVLEGRANVIAANPAASDGRIHTVLAILDGEVIGHFTSYPERLRIGGAERGVAWTAGFHVLPEHRSGPIGVMLAKEMGRVAPNSMCSTVLDAPLRIFTAMGWRHVGTVPNYVYFTRPSEVLRRLPPELMGQSGARRFVLSSLQRSGMAGLCGGLVGLMLRARTAGLGRSFVQTRTVTKVADWVSRAEADALWARCAEDVAAGLVRDGARVCYRFRDERYVLIEARRAGALVGWIVLRRPEEGGSDRLGGVRVAPVSDLMFDPSDLGVCASLLRAAIRYARGGFADALVVSTPHTPTIQMARRLGFLSMAGNLHLVVHASLLADATPNFEEWWHARGDGDADQSF